MPNPQDTVQVLVPTPLRDRLKELRLHPRQPLYEIIEAAVDFWEDHGGWAPIMPAPVDPYPERTSIDALRARKWSEGSIPVAAAAETD